MHSRKSHRHVIAAQARWRAAEVRAQAQRDAGIPDREPYTDTREPIQLDLTTAGGPNLRLEPRLGFVAWRARDVCTGQVLHCCALKELLHRIADDLPRMASPSRGLQHGYTVRDELDARAC